MGDRTLLIFFFCHLLCCTHIFRAVITIIFPFPWTYPDSRGLQKVDLKFAFFLFIFDVCSLARTPLVEDGEAALSSTFRTSNLILFFFLFFLAVPWGLWDLSSPTRD